MKVWKKLQDSWFKWADLNQHSRWFPVFLACLAAVDAYFMVLPGDTVLLLAVLSSPKRWKREALSFAIGSVLGAFLLFLTIRATGESWPAHWNPLVHPAAPPGAAREFFAKHGLFSLALGSLIPGLSWPTVILAGFSNGPVLLALLYLVVGRFLRYGLLCFGVKEGWTLFRAVKTKVLDSKPPRSPRGRP